jgi:hypothetical protein
MTMMTGVRVVACMDSSWCWGFLCVFLFLSAGHGAAVARSPCTSPRRAARLPPARRGEPLISYVLLRKVGFAEHTPHARTRNMGPPARTI